MTLLCVPHQGKLSYSMSEGFKLTIHPEDSSEIEECLEKKRAEGSGAEVLLLRERNTLLRFVCDVLRFVCGLRRLDICLRHPFSIKRLINTVLKPRPKDIAVMVLRSMGLNRWRKRWRKRWRERGRGLTASGEPWHRLILA